MFFLTFISQNICFAQLNLVDDLFKAVRRLSKYRNISKFEYKKLLKTLNASELTLVVNNLPTNLRNEALLEIAQQRNLIKPIEFISLRRQLSTVTVYEKTLIKHISNNEKNLAKKIETEVVKIRNSKLAGKTHPVTGVPYNSRGFPQFESKFKVKLPKNLYKKSNNEQFAYANKQLAKDIEKDKTLRDQFTERQL
jgi:MinD-like ATPase involved in chromosome partitioning or flagellar assembly